MDVRDVAQAHLLAVENDAADGRRFLIVRSLRLLVLDVTHSLLSHPQTGPTLIPSEWIRILARVLPSHAPHLPRPLDLATEKEEKEKTYTLDDSASKEVLGLVYHSSEETLRDAAQWWLKVAGPVKK